MSDISATIAKVQTATGTVTAASTLTATFSAQPTVGSNLMVAYLGGDAVTSVSFPEGWIYAENYGVLATFLPRHYVSAWVLYNYGENDDRSSFTFTMSGNTTGFWVAMEFTGPQGYLRPLHAAATRSLAGGGTSGSVGSTGLAPDEEAGSIIVIGAHAIQAAGNFPSISGPGTSAIAQGGTITAGLQAELDINFYDYTGKGANQSDQFSLTRSAPNTNGAVTSSVFAYVMCTAADCMVNGWEFGGAYTNFGSTAGNWATDWHSTAGHSTSTTASRPASSGTYGYLASTGTSTSGGVSQTLPYFSSWQKTQMYCTLHAKNTTGTIGLYGVGGPSTGFGVGGIANNINNNSSYGIGYNPATDKFCAYAKLPGSTTFDASQDGTVTPTLDQWYKLNFHLWCDSNGYTIDWWIDDVQQTSLTVATSGSTLATTYSFPFAWLWGSHIVSASGTATVYLDDGVVHAAPGWTKFPLEGNSVVGLYTANGEGTHNNATSNLKSDTENPITSLTTTYQKVSDSLADDRATWVGAISGTTPESTYLEWATSSPSLGGMGTLYAQAVTTSTNVSAKFLTVRALLGSETYPIPESHNKSWPNNGAPGAAGANSGVGIGGQGNATLNKTNAWGGPKAKTPANARYSSTDWDALLIRCGWWSGTLEDALATITYQHIEVDDPLDAPGDRWGWSDTTAEAWQWVRG